MAAPKPRVLVLGHSFVHRLESAFFSGFPQMDMDLDQFHIKFHGRGGASVLDTLNYDVIAQQSVVRTFCPSVVVLQCAGNSLCKHKAAVVGERLLYLVETLLGFAFVRNVVILDAFPRENPRYITPELYAERMEDLNLLIRARVTLREFRGRTMCWNHRRLADSPLQIFHGDGVHLSRDIGMPKYWRVVRGAILHGAAEV